MVKMLREADRTSVAGVAKKHGLSEQTMYVWKRRFGGMSVVETIGKQLHATARTVTACIALCNRSDMLKVGLFGNALVVVKDSAQRTPRPHVGGRLELDRPARRAPGPFALSCEADKLRRSR